MYTQTRKQNNRVVACTVLCSLAFIAAIFISTEINNSADCLPDNETTAIVKYVVDGDTFELTTGERVRLIGIDTPEKGEPYAYEATLLTKTLIDKRTVTLISDEGNTDKYGRLLRYVVVDGVLVNSELLRLGYAEPMTIKPNTSCAGFFNQIAR